MGERSRYGLAVSTLGAVVLAVSVFLPWYGVSLTANGATAAGRVREQLAALSAHDAPKTIGVLLLVLAALALVDSLVPLARAAAAVPYGAGGATTVLGLIACACVLYRMLDVPAPAGELLALSLREGSWLALGGSLTMVLGGLWPRATADGGDRQVDVWAGLSGWSPQA